MEKIAPILDEVVRKITTVRRFMPIIYLVSEDREILFDLFRRKDCFEILQKRGDSEFVPCEYDQNIKDLNVIQVTSSHAWNNNSPLGKRDKTPAIDWPVRYYYIRDFSTVEQKQSYIQNYIGRIEAQGDGPLTENLIIISPVRPYDCIPIGFEQYVEVIDVPIIGMREIAELTLGEQNQALAVMGRPPLELEAFLPQMDPFLEKFKGLNRQQIRHVLRQLAEQFGWVSLAGLTAKERKTFDQGALVRSAQEKIYEQKRQMVLKDGTIDFLPTDALARPGGMEGLCQWIEQKKKVLADPANARQRAEKFPRGILIAGLPGSGKSMVAKFIAHQLNDMPLIQFRFSRVLTGVVGGTEEKLDRALKLIEASVPCVVWIDEIEKELGGTQSSGESDAGVASRCLATLLHWMQENRKACFICATANHVDTLPAELMRRGRFDRKYYTFLPLQEQCVEILVCQLRQIASEAPELFDHTVTSQLFRLSDEVFDAAAKLEGKFFTGSDIEGLLQDAKSLLFQRDEPIPYSYETVKRALLQTLQHYQPYGETNFAEILDYWTALQKHPFLHAAMPENASAEDKGKYMLFDFSDFVYDGRSWSWKDGLSCTSPYPYDQAMFQVLKSGIGRHQNVPKNNTTN